jgi:PAS domain S-box-containing protein
MRDQNKTKSQLIDELGRVRRQILEHESVGATKALAVGAWRKHEDFAQILLNVIGDAAVLISIDGTVLCLNEVAADQFGKTGEALIGRNFFELLEPNVAAENRIRILDAVRSGMPIRSVDMRGASFTETIVSPISRPGGKIEMLTLFFRDVTSQMKADLELRRAKEAAESADLAKSQFLANVSHELRTPLNAIIGFSEILESETFGPLNQRQFGYVRSVAFSGRLLLELINDILDLTKIESGKMDLNISEVNLGCVVECSLSMVAETTARRSVTVSVDIDEAFSNYVFQADERKLVQILSNLFANAVKFTPEGGRIEVKASLEGDSCTVTVTDTGIGITQEDQERIFRPFFQVDSSYAREAHGTGLGLALCRRLVELHGGRIWVESSGINHGSKFSFSVPVVGFRRITDEPET